MINVRTDLALEAREIYKESHKDERDIDGIEVLEETDKDIKVTTVKVKNDDGAKKLGKPKGNYVTIDIPQFTAYDGETMDRVSEVVAEVLSRMIEIDVEKTILVVGLGNWQVTPDALGPKVTQGIMVTRHLKTVMPEAIDNSVRPVCSISPGVLGVTGVETVEIIKGVVERVKPDLVICIDALAARDSKRVNSTIQIGDTGISPGAGVGNNRKRINEENLGLVKSLNKALKLCNGDFIARMDADDFSDSKRFEEQIKFLNENPDISLCATGVTIMNEDGCDLYKAKIYGTTPKKAEKSLIYRNVFPHGSWMFRREILDKIYGYREIPQAEDYELLFRMLDMGEKIAVLPKYLFKYRLRTNGISFKSLYNQKKMMIEIKNKYIQCKNDKKEFIFNLQKDINTSEEEIEKYLKYQNIYTESISQIRTKKRFIEFKNIIKVFIKCSYKREELKSIIALKLINK